MRAVRVWMDEVKLMDLVYMSRSHKMVPSPLPFSVNIRHLHISHNTLCQCLRKFCTIPGVDYSAPDNSRFVVAIVQWGIEDNAPAKFWGGKLGTVFMIIDVQMANCVFMLTEKTLKNWNVWTRSFLKGRKNSPFSKKKKKNEDVWATFLKRYQPTFVVIFW